MSRQIFTRFLLYTGTFILLAVCTSGCFSTSSSDQKEAKSVVTDTVHIAPDPVMYLGIPISNYHAVEGLIKSGEVISDILSHYNVSWEDILFLVDTSKSTFDLSRIRRGNSYTVYLEPHDSIVDPAFFVYQVNAVDHIRVSLKDSLTVAKVSLPVTVKRQQSSIKIQSSLYDAIAEKNLPTALAIKLADIYAWTVDFYRLNKKDEFYCVYETSYVENTPVETGEIIAAYYISGKDTLQAYRFYHDSLDSYQYFSEKGENLQRSMLKSPLEFGRLTSGYSLKRFHPVQKRYKAHLGTDYAAAHGTPILAVGNGTIIKAQRGRFNGNYVKIRHNETYTSQYLHMSRFAKKTRVGTKVQQGDVIGYVGSTGLATGPHVCFRLWKNGKQVNHLREKFSPAAPLPQTQLNAYSDSLMVWKTDLLGLQAAPVL